MNYFFKIVKISIFLCLIVNISLGCRYTVREIGFSDLNFKEITLTVKIPSNLSDEDQAGIKNILYGSFFDTNINYKTKSGSADNLIVLQIGNYADTIKIEENFENQLWKDCESIASSPLRQQLIEELPTSFAVILIINTSEEINHKIEVARSNFQKIKRELPKIVSDNIDVITLNKSDLNSEKVLLDFLKISDYQQSHIVVFYGRGRKMGPVLSGEEITSDKIYNLVSIIGADCECGLNVNWKLGQQIPLRWPDENDEILYKKFGFDFSNPMVKDEMSKILAINNYRVKKIKDPLKTNIIEHTEKNPDTTISTQNNSSFFFLLIIGILSIIFIITAIIFLKKRDR